MSQKHDEIINTFESRILASHSTFMDVKKTSTEAYRLYTEKFPDALKNDPRFRHDMFIPMIHTYVQTHVGRIMTDSGVVKLSLPASNAESKLRARLVEKYINFQAAQGGYNSEAEVFITNLIITGTAWGMVAYDKQYRYIKSYQFDEITGETNLKTTPKLMFEGPKLVAINHDDIFWDPMATCRDDLRWVIRRVNYSMKHLERQNSNDDLDYKYINLDKAKELLKKRGSGASGSISFESSEANEDWLAHIGVAEYDTQVPVKDDMIVCHEMWDFENWTLQIIAQGEVVIQDIPIPFEHGHIPFVVAQDYPIPFTLIGKGARTFESFQIFANAMINQYLESAALSNRIMLATTDTELTDDQINNLFSTGQGILRLNGADINKVFKQFSFNGLSQSQSFVMAFNLVMNLYEKSSATPEQAQGVISKSDTTATEADIANRALNVTTFNHLRRIYNDFTAVTSRLFYEFDKEMMEPGYQQDFQSENRWYQFHYEALASISADDLIKPAYEDDGLPDLQTLFTLWQETREDPTINGFKFFEAFIEKAGFEPPWDEYYTGIAEVLKELSGQVAVNEGINAVAITDPGAKAQVAQTQLMQEAAATMPMPPGPGPMPQQPQGGDVPPQQPQGGGDEQV